MSRNAPAPQLAPDGDTRAILWPAVEENPASIVAAIGAADLLDEAGHRGVGVRWVPVDPDDRLGARARHVPEIVGDGPLTLRDLARAISEATCPDRTLLPGGGKGQTHAGAVEVARAPDEDLPTALFRVYRDLRRAGHSREAALLAGCVGYRRTDGYRAIRRTPWAIGAKSDLRAAGEGWAMTRPGGAAFGVDRIERELRSSYWDYCLISGDWGLDSNQRGEARQFANVKLGSPTLSRLLTQGIIAAGRLGLRALTPFASLRESARMPNRLGWPIWTDAISIGAARSWWSWAFDPFPRVEPDSSDPPNGHHVVRVPSALRWYVSDLVPVSQMLSTYWVGELVNATAVGARMEERLAHAR